MLKLNLSISKKKLRARYGQVGIENNSNWTYTWKLITAIKEKHSGRNDQYRSLNIRGQKEKL